MCSLGSWTEVNSRARYFGRTNQIRRRCKQTLFSGKKSYVVMWRWRKALASVEIEWRTLQRPEAPFVSKTIDRFGRFERALSENRPPCLIAYMLVQWRAYKEAYMISRDYSRLVTSLSLRSAFPKILMYFSCALQKFLWFPISDFPNFFRSAERLVSSLWL